MTVYRALMKLDRGSKGVIQRGQIIVDRGWKETYIDRLIEVGAVAPISAPPISTLPGWGDSDEVLAGIGVTTADQLLEANDEAIMSALEIDRPQLAKMRADVMGWLTVPESNC